MPGIGISISPFLNRYTGGGYTPDPDATAYLNVLPIEGTTGYQDLIKDTLFPILKGGNNNFQYLDRLFLNSVDYRYNAYYSAVNPTSTPSSEQGGMLWNELGFKGAASSYVRSNYIPSVDGVNFTKDSNCFFYWSLTELANNNANDMGAQNTTPTERAIISFARTGANTWAASDNDSTGGSSTTASTTSIGLFFIKRISATTFLKYKDVGGVMTLVDTKNITSTSLTDLELYMFGINRNGSLLFPSARQIPFFGWGSKDVDPQEIYDFGLAYTTGMAALYPSPSTLQVQPINNARLKLAIPSLVDASGNGYDSVLGASTPVGFTSPTIDADSNIDFNGLQTIKLNASMGLTQIRLHTQFFVVKLSTPEVTQGFLNVDTVYSAGTRLYASTHDGNKFVTAGGVYLDEAAITQPVWGRSLPKMHQGYAVIGLSFSATTVYMFYNGMISYFTPNCAYGATGLSGWLGAFPGGTYPANNYTLPAYYKLVNGSFVEIFNYAATKDQVASKGAEIMYNSGLSLLLAEGDSITQGFTLTNNSENYIDLLTGYLLANTSYKWSTLNMAIGGRKVQQAAIQDSVDSSVTYNWTTTVTVTPVPKVLGATNKNIMVAMYGINDIAAGRTLLQLQSDFTTWINYRNSIGYNCFILTPTGDSLLTAPMETIRLDFNTWLATQEGALNFTLIDICNNITGANTSPIDAGLRNDGVHWNATMHNAVFDYAKGIILANL